MEDQPLVNPRQDFEIKENGQATLLLDLQPDPRHIVFTGPLTSRVKEVVDSSTIEARPASEWLTDPAVRPSRRACLLNILAKASCFPSRSYPFISHIQSNFLAAPDRIYATVDSELQPMLAKLADDPRKPIYHEGRPTSACHKRLLEVVKQKGLPGAAAAYKPLDSYRQEGGPCLQFVVADPDGVEAPSYADIDIDLGNPLQDLAGLIVHAGEVLSGRLTDHLALRKTLGKNRQVAQFLCYDVVSGAPA